MWEASTLAVTPATMSEPDRQATYSCSTLIGSLLLSTSPHGDSAHENYLWIIVPFQFTPPSLNLPRSCRFGNKERWWLGTQRQSEIRAGNP